MRNPTEVLVETINAGIKKANTSTLKEISLSFIAGIFVAFSASSFLLITVHFKENIGLGKVIAGLLFPIGLMLIIVFGCELFSSNATITVALFDKKVKFYQLIKNLIIVFYFNILATLLMAYLSVKSKVFSPEVIQWVHHLAEEKVSSVPWQAFIRAIFCNVLVCSAVLMSYASKYMHGKLFAILFPILLFVVLGYDHAIANSFYLFASLSDSATKINWANAYSYLSVIAIGNILGGAFVLGIPLYYLHYKYKDKQKNENKN